MPRVLCSRVIGAPAERCFDACRDVGAHLRSLAATGESVVGGRTEGLLELGERTTFRARHFGVWFELCAEIVELERPHRFVDAMVRGPFRRFRHEHIFRAVSKTETLVEDQIDFCSPYGPLGTIVDLVLLRPYLTRLVEARMDHIQRWAEGRDGDS